MVDLMIDLMVDLMVDFMVDPMAESIKRMQARVPRPIGVRRGPALRLGAIVGSKSARDERVRSVVARCVAIAMGAIPLAVAAAADTPPPDSTPATAPTPPPAESTVGQLQSITVTATKRTEDIKDIPTSVSAIDADQLAEHHVANYDDITRTVPSVSFQAGAGPGLDNIEIRGVSSTSGSATVGIYIDEVPVTVKNTYDGAVQPKLFDLERVEVLRGPQGTLYGSSSMGGTIRFITKQPDLNQFSGTAATDLSYTKHGSVNDDSYAILNLPIIPGTFAIRLGADVSYESGYVDHYTGTTTGIPPGGTPANGELLTLNTNDSTGVLAQKGVNDVHTEVFRISGKYAAPSDLTITPAFFFQRTAVGDSGIFYPSLGLYEQDKRIGEPGKDIVTVPSLTINKGFGFADLTSITSYFRRDFHRTTDGTYYNSNVLSQIIDAYDPVTPTQAYLTSGIIGFLPSPVYYDTTTDQFSQELRLASNETKIAGVPVNWVGGVFFSNQRQYHTDDEYIPGVQAAYQQIFGQNIFYDPVVGGAGLPGVSYANDLIYFAHNQSSERQLAPFGEFGVSITHDLKASVGLRYVTAKTSYGFTSGGYYAYGLPNPYSDNEKFSSTTPKFSLDYAINDHSNVYTTIAKGFRLGGPTGPDPANVPGASCDQDYANLGIAGAPLKYDSDSLWSYELGSKGRYFDNHLSVNAAVYAIDWKNIQQSVNLPICGFSFTTNAGDAHSYGTEVEIRGVVSNSLTVGLNAGTTHAYITHTLDPGVFSVGEEILNVPDYTITPSADYDTQIDENTSAFARLDFPYTGRSHAYYNSSTVINHWSPNYGILNANFGVVHKKLTVGLYAKNLLDKKKIIQYPSVNTVQEGYTVRPLTAGITASYQF
jgi:outer membrane receptor protein involved in Fe transport